MPAYARIGAFADEPVNAAISAADGPVPVMVRPWRPSDSHDTNDPGPPDRSGLVGCSTPSAVVVLRTEKLRSARAASPFSSRPLTTSQVTTTTATQPRALAARGPIHRRSRPATRW